MVGLASALSLCLGVCLAARAPSAGLRAQAFETSGGVFLVSGLVLLGAGLFIIGASWWHAAFFVALFVLLSIKARLEERMLAARFPERVVSWPE